MNYSLVTVGNPNSGKTSLFNALTGARQQVGNWSGVTVDKKMGEFSAQGHDYKLMDLPGIYSLANQEGSLDEQIASRFVEGLQPDLLLNVIDAANLERSLHPRCNCASWGRPWWWCSTRWTSCKSGASPSTSASSPTPGCPVVTLRPTTASRSPPSRTRSSSSSVSRSRRCCWTTAMSLKDLAELETCSPRTTTTRGRALRLLEEDAVMQETLLPGQQAAAANVVARAHHGQDVDPQLADIRYGHIHQWAAQACQQKASSPRPRASGSIGCCSTAGLASLLPAGDVPDVHVRHQVGSALSTSSTSWAAPCLSMGAPPAGADPCAGLAGAILADGFGVGLQTVATFIPVIGCLYLFLAVLEIRPPGPRGLRGGCPDASPGLPGKAFVPMLMGFGCTVPSVMATRTLNLSASG